MAVPGDARITAVPIPSQVIPTESVYPFAFTGGGAEYFRVWVVNTFLVIATLGLYSPWAKIRKRQFFLRHTWVAGANFDFHAEPWPILRGRLIAGGLFVVYWFLGNVNPQHAAWLGLVLAVATPWLVATSLRFNLANTSYRNLRFRFRGGLRDSLNVFWPFVAFAVLTLIFPLEFDGMSWGREQWNGLIPTLVLALLYPWFIAAYRLMLLGRSCYGNANLSTRASIRNVYAIYLRATVLALVLAVPASICTALLVILVKSRSIDPTAILHWSTQALFILGLLPWAAVILVLYAYTQSRVANVTISASRFTVPPVPPAVAGSEVRLRSALRMRALVKLYLLNLLAVLATAGLAIPWAAVRSARVRADATTLVTLGSLDDVLASDAWAGGATADAASEFFSLDIAL